MRGNSRQLHEVAMNLQVAASLVPASPEALQKLDAINSKILQYEQISITTEHIFHGGMYSRTIRLKPGTVMMGSLIKKPTLLIVNGTTSVLVGDEQVELEGYNVIPGCAGRKQLFATRGPVEMTMIFATEAKTVEEAENEVFAEADKLMSRADNSRDTIIVTGE